MDYSTDYSHQSSPQRVWPPHLLTPQQTQQTQQQQQHQQQPGPFPSPISPGTFFFPAQAPSHQQQPGAPQTSPSDSRSGLSLNLSGLSVASPPSVSPIAHQAQPGQLHPHQLHARHSIPHQPHHAHSHSHSSTSSISGPITPVSPPSMPLLSPQPQPQFSFNFDDPSGGLSPTQDPPLSQRRPTSSHSVSCSELAPEKSVPRKRSLTNTLPVSPSAGSVHSMHQHSQSHPYPSSLNQAAHPFPHPIITTTASSPPLPTSSASSPSSHPSHSHSRSLSHSHSHSSFSQSHSPQHSLPQIDINATPASPYDDIDSTNAFAGIGDDASDDDLGSPSGVNANSKTSGPSQQGQSMMGKSGGTNNFVTKLHNMINDTKSQHFISWTESGASFVVSNVSEFSRKILGSHFKHNNFSSFVRQLNMYGFHKINRTPRAQRTSSTSQTWEFSHPKFLRGRADLLEAIKRKALEPDPKERSRVELPGEVKGLLSELRNENRALWRELRSLSSRIPQHVPSHGPTTISSNFGGSVQGPQSHMSPTAQVGLGGGGHFLTHSRSSSNLGCDDGDRDIEWEDDDMNTSVMTSIGMGSQEEEWNAHSPDFNFGTSGGVNVPGFTFGTPFGGDDWKRWAEGEIMREKRRVERLVCIVKALAERGGANTATSMGAEPDGIPPSILQELHELSLSFDIPSPISGPIPSPSPSPSPHPLTRHQHSPNIFITSPTSPTPHGSHSRSASRESQARTNLNAILPTLSIPSPGPSPQSATSSPTVSDYVPQFFNHKPGHTRSLSHLGVRTRQPNIMLTLDMDDVGRVEKRARTEDDKVKEGLAGEQMDIVPSEPGEDAKLPSPISLAGRTSPTMNATMCINTVAGSNKIGSRSRSDSAPMWGGDGSSGGLSANWTGRGRSGSSFGQ